MNSPETSQGGFSETDWIVKAGLLQIAEGEGIYDGYALSDDVVFRYDVTAATDRYEPIDTVDDVVDVIDPAGFSADGRPINPGPWMIVVEEAYIPELSTPMPDRFQLRRGRVDAVTKKFFALDEATQIISIVYMETGRMFESPNVTQDMVLLHGVLDSLAERLKGHDA